MIMNQWNSEQRSESPSIAPNDMIMITDNCENENFSIDDDNDNEIDIIYDEFIIMQQRFKSIKKHYHQLISNMNTMKILFEQFEYETNQFGRKLKRNLRNSQSTIDKYRNDRKYSTESIVYVNIEIDQTSEMKKCDNNDDQNNNNNTNAADKDDFQMMNIDENNHVLIGKNFPDIKKLDIEEIDLLSSDTIDHLIDSLGKDAINDPRIANDDGHILFNSIAFDEVLIENRKNIENSIPNESLIIIKDIDDDDYSVESMKTATDYFLNDEYHLSDINESLKTDDSLLINDQSENQSIRISDVDDDTISESIPGNSQSSDEIIDDNDKSYEINDNCDSSELLDLNQELSSINYDDNNNEFSWMNKNNGNNIDDHNESAGDLRINIVNDGDDKLFVFSFDHDGCSTIEHVKLKPIKSRFFANGNSNDTDKITMNSKKNKHCNDDNDNDIMKPRSPSFNDDLPKFNLGEMRKFWERRSLGPHKKFKK